MITEDKKELIKLINEWNSSRYDLFAISQPNENLEFHGVMRFYFQDAGQKVSTKCIRVESTATTEDVIKVLIEKFRPDMKTLSSSRDYAIYEIHSNSEEHKLANNEKPLWIQLEWGKDGTEGRFLLKNENDKTVKVIEDAGSLLREKKKQSKKDSKHKKQQANEETKENNKKTVAENLYKEVPDSNFTRSISNPEIVMARRRQQKIEQKLKQIKNRDGGGTLKVYGETLKPDIPYKTLLLSNHDTVGFAVKETLDKYGLLNEDSSNYCLIQVIQPTKEERDKNNAQIREIVLEDSQCPLAILMQHSPASGSIIFQIRRLTPELIAKRKMQQQQAHPPQPPTSLPPSIQQQQHHPNHTIPSSPPLSSSTKYPLIINDETIATQKHTNYGTLYDINNELERDFGSKQTLNNGIPGIVEFQDKDEDKLIQYICNNSHHLSHQFKLSPVYTLYMMFRYRLSHQYRSDMNIKQKLSICALQIQKLMIKLKETIVCNYTDKYFLSFWLSNLLEFIYFLKNDVNLRLIYESLKQLLIDCIQLIYEYFVNTIQTNLNCLLSAFYDPSDHVEDVIIDNDEQKLFNEQIIFDKIKRPTLRHVLHVLNEVMGLLRSCRVNASLTIQIFSQLFHYISVWLFNKLINDNRSGLCSSYWGSKLSRRLRYLYIWSQKHGIDLAADCNLAKITQTAFLLQVAKHDFNNLSLISSNCYTLNSLQIKCIFKNYIQTHGEPTISYQLVNGLISIAQNTVDEQLRSKGKQMGIDEDCNLQLPFILPDDGHSCDMVKGLPVGLMGYIEALQNMNLCYLRQNKHGIGEWDEFMIGNNNNHEDINNRDVDVDGDDEGDGVDLEVIKVNLNKKVGSLGLSIVAAKAHNQPYSGIFIKSIVNGGAAHLDGRLDAGDLILAVDSISLNGLTQEKAAEILTKSKVNVTLTVAKHAAHYYGLSGIIDKESASTTPTSTNGALPPPPPPPPPPPIPPKRLTNLTNKMQTLPHHHHQQQQMHSKQNYENQQIMPVNKPVHKKQQTKSNSVNQLNYNNYELLYKTSSNQIQTDKISSKNHHINHHNTASLQRPSASTSKSSSTTTTIIQKTVFSSSANQVNMAITPMDALKQKSPTTTTDSNQQLTRQNDSIDSGIEKGAQIRPDQQKIIVSEL